MKNYNINSDDFLNYVHEVKLDRLKRSEKLIQLLSQLPGKKIIYTNGDFKHAQNILGKLEILDFFYGIFDIKKGDLIPKPQKESLIKLIKYYNIDPLKTVYFEDIKKNLQNAFNLGVTTILIDYNKKSLKNSYVDYSFKTIISALNALKDKLN